MTPPTPVSANLFSFWLASDFQGPCSSCEMQYSFCRKWGAGRVASTGRHAKRVWQSVVHDNMDQKARTIMLSGLSRLNYRGVGDKENSNVDNHLACCSHMMADDEQRSRSMQRLQVSSPFTNHVNQS